MSLDALLHRKETPWLRQFLQSPIPSLARTLYTQRQKLVRDHQLDPTKYIGITVVCISDTHNLRPEIPEGDVLIHAGDLTQNGTAPELQSQLDWLNAQPHPHKVVIAGNHDIVLDQQKSSEHGFSDHDRASLQWGSITYLERSAFSIRPKGGKRAVSIHGDPRTQRHGNWAFQYEKGSDVFSNQLGTDIDILITHAAPHYHLDVAGWGDVNLLRELWRVKPKLHVFGHIHQGRGSEILVYDQFELLYEQIRAERTGLLGLFYMAFLLLRISFMQDRTSERTILINASCVGGQRDQLCRNAHVVHI